MVELPELKTLEEKTRKGPCKWILISFLNISRAMRAGRLYLQGWQLVGTPISLCMHNLAWKTEASPALALGPLVSLKGAAGAGADLLSGSLIFVPPFTAQLQCTEYLYSRLHGCGLGDPLTPLSLLWGPETEWAAIKEAPSVACSRSKKQDMSSPNCHFGRGRHTWNCTE